MPKTDIFSRHSPTSPSASAAAATTAPFPLLAPPPAFKAAPFPGPRQAATLADPVRESTSTPLAQGAPSEDRRRPLEDPPSALVRNACTPPCILQVASCLRLSLSCLLLSSRYPLPGCRAAWRWSTGGAPQLSHLLKVHINPDLFIIIQYFSISICPQISSTDLAYRCSHYKLGIYWLITHALCT